MANVVRKRMVILAAAAVLIGAAVLLLPLLSRQNQTEVFFNPLLVNHPAALGLMLEEQDDGLYVLAVGEKSPAKDAGIRPGDLLTELNGSPLETLDGIDALLQDMSVSDSLTFLLLRDQQTLSISLAIPTAPAEGGA